MTSAKCEVDVGEREGGYNYKQGALSLKVNLSLVKLRIQY